MSVAADESTTILGRKTLVELIEHYRRSGVGSRHVLGFVMFAMLGMWQRRFLVRGDRITPDDLERCAWRVAAEIEKLVLPPLPNVASLAFDREVRIDSIRDAYASWSGLFNAPGGILERVRMGRATSEDIELEEEWRAAREHFWPPRDMPEFMRAAARASRALDLPVEGDSLRARIEAMRGPLLLEGGLYRAASGELRIGSRDLRDRICKHEGVSRPRPDRERKRKHRAPKRMRQLPREIEDASTTIEIAVGAEEAAALAAWARSRLRKDSSRARRAVLRRMIRDPGARIEVRALASEVNMDKAGISRARSALALEWQAHRATRRDS